MTPVPHDLPLPLPAPEWLLITFLIVSFMIHILFVNLMVGGTLLTVIYEWIGRRQSSYDDLAHEIAKTITVNKSLAVVFGVAPLLVINVLYTTYFYTANALTGIMWILIIPLVSVAFLLTYLHKYTWQALAEQKNLHLAIGITAALIFLLIPIVFLVNINLMLFPERWPDVRGFFSAMMLPNVFPRYLHFLAASFAVTGLFLVGYIKRSSFLFEEKVQGMSHSEAIKGFYTVALIATGSQFVVGPLVYFTLPSHGLSVAMSLVIMVGVVCATPAAFWLWKEVSSKPSETVGRYFYRITFFFTLTVIFMVTGRHMYRANALSDHQTLVKKKTLEFAAASRKARELSNMKDNNSIATEFERGKAVFNSYCAPCHDLHDRLVGPPVRVIQEDYFGNSKGIAAWVLSPGKNRADYPQMPAILLPDDDLNAVANYLLEMK